MEGSEPGVDGRAGQARALPLDELLFLRAVVRSIGEAVCVTDLDNRLLFVNDAFRRLYGYADEELVGRPIDLLVSPRTPAGTSTHVAQATVGGGWQGEVWNRRKDGTEFPIRLSTAPVLDERGQAVALVGVTTDISEVKEAAAALAQQLEILTKIHEVSVEMASLPSSADLFGYLARTLQRLTGAMAVTLGEFRPQDGTIVLRRLESDSTSLALANRILGIDARNIVSAVDATTLAHILSTRIEVHDSLTSVSFGAVPPTVARILQGLLHVDRFVAVAYVYEGILYGTSVLAFRAGTPLPSTILVEAFASLAAVSLRRQGAEESLREHQSMVSALVDSSRDWIWALDARGVHTYSNPAVEHILGYRPGEIVGMSLELVHEDDKAKLDQVWRESVATGRGWTTVQARWRHRDGHYRYMESSAVPILARDGGVLGFRGVDRDVTDRVETAEEIANWKRRYDRLALSAGNVVYDFDTSSGTIVCGGGLENTLGYTPQELNGSIEQWVERIRPDEREAVKARFREAEAQAAVFHAEYHFRRRDGRYVLLEDRGYPLQNVTGGIERYVGVMTDVTELRRAEAERARLEEHLRQTQKMESIGRLAGGVAHDFNNLLTIINGYSDLIADTLNPADPLRATVEQIRKAGERASALTQRLLAFSRKQVMQPRPLNVDRVVSDLQPMLARLVGEDVDLRLALDAGGAVIRADPHQIEQVILNVVVNSRDAMPRGGTLTIETAATGEPGADGRVMIAVADTGFGMDEATRQQVFEPFFTTKGSGKGTGLGLSIVQGIVEQTGGTIDVESVPGEGTTFRISLPRVDASPEAAVTLSPGRQALIGRETVLVVEDEPDVRNYVATALRTYGYRVLVAENAGEALLICDRDPAPIDLLLTDVVMPHVSGRELAERVEKVRPGIKVIYMSGYTDDIVVHHGVTEEGIGFVQKPFSPDQLATRLREVLVRGRENPIGN
jgi:PAS domain S-box-containing protein